MSKSDPEATLSGKHGEYKSLRYKTHNMADAESRVILDCHVTTGIVAETTMFQSRLEATEKELNLKVKEVIADRGFGSAENLRYLEKKDINWNIPLWSSRSGESYFELLKQGFRYDEVNKGAYCPEGHRMKASSREEGRTCYTLPRRTCLTCPRFETCVTDGEKKAGRGKRFFVPDHIRLFEITLKKQEEPEFKLKLRERMWKMEGLFAEGKTLHGLHRVRYRGRSKLQSQVYMISTVQNLKRLAQAIVIDLISKLLDLMKVGSSIGKLQKLELRLAFGS